MKNIVEPYSMGVVSSHSTDFIFERPHGYRSHCLVMCFRTPAEILTPDGMKTIRPGDCFIHTPRFHLLHYSVRGAKSGFCNDWIYIRNDVLLKSMRGMKLARNEPIAVGRPDLLEESIKLLQQESTHTDEYSETSIQTLITAMMVKIARAAKEMKLTGNDKKAKGSTHTQQLTQIRKEMVESFQKQWTVKQLARKLCLSPERFSALYRLQFGSSPIQDLIEARLQNAKTLLLYSDKTIGQIAMESGFSEIYYFSRLFKKHNGVSPLKWQKS